MWRPFLLSQSHRTAQGNSESNETLESTRSPRCRNPTVLLRAIPSNRLQLAAYKGLVAVAIPPYCSGQFRGTGVVRDISGMPHYLSQSHRTAQGNSEAEGIRGSDNQHRRSQSHRTAQGNSEISLSNALNLHGLRWPFFQPPRNVDDFLPLRFVSACRKKM
jgi:hypothetical protein